MYIYVVNQSTKYCYRFAFSHLFTHFLLQCCRKEIRCFIELVLLWNFKLDLKIAMLANGASHGFCTKKISRLPQKNAVVMYSYISLLCNVIHFRRTAKRMIQSKWQLFFCFVLGGRGVETVTCSFLRAA